MEKILKTFLNSYALVGFFAVFGFWLFFKRKGDGVKSTNSTVNDAIYELDSAFNAVGTFDWDTDKVLVVFQKLSSSDIKKLYKDFGTRYYNKVIRKYQVLEIFGDYGVSTEMNLQNILEEELGTTQKEQLKIIHENKGLQYPYLS